MARPLRIEYSGAWYHVINRGLERRKIFLYDRDYLNFLALLKEITALYSIEIHAFSLMPNHYHLLIHTPNTGLSRAMRHLNGVYTQKFNKTHGRDGPLFRGRYKALLIDSNEYLTKLIHYIHLNPVEAKLCRHPKDHSWTSHKYYLKDTKGLEWLHKNEILSSFSKNLNKARKILDTIIQNKISDDIIKEIEQPSHNIIGSHFFKKWANSNFVENKSNTCKEITNKDKTIKPKIGAKQLLENIAFCYDVKVKDIRQSQSGQKNEARTLAIHLMRYRLGCNLKEIAKWLKTENEYAIAQILFKNKRKLAQNERHAKHYRELELTVIK